MPTSISSLLAEGAARLARATDAPRREAETLLGAALGRPRAYLLAHPDETILDCDATDVYEAYLTRRAHGEPVAYLLGEKEFWSLTLAVTRDVLIPRPETERVVELALAHLAPDIEGARVLDLATGSGAIALAIAHERPRAHVVGTDVSPAAIEVARGNATRLRLAQQSGSASGAGFRVGSWYEPVAGERYDLIAANPPYVAADDPRIEPAVRRYEPHGALFAGGADGLDAIRTIVAGAPRHLAPGGWLVVEHGTGQGAAVRALFESAGLERVATHRDLAGHDRVTEGRYTMQPSRPTTQVPAP
jgi:release factor glutamine methyltransferase